MNHANYDWWSFHDINASNFSGCGSLTGPTAVVISEEMPPSKLTSSILRYMHSLVVPYIII